ncbi:MAG TPA: efflux RND transporter periplasmic adaptor subunit [Polyangiaceae bacterium]
MHTERIEPATTRPTLAFLTTCLVSLLWGCLEQPAPQRPDGSRREVVVGEASRSSRPIVTEVVGTVRAVRSATIAPLISGTVAEVRVGLGSAVRAGDVLVRLSAEEVHARLEQARAASALAQREHERAESLRSKEVISSAEYDAAVSHFSIARARQAEASTVAGRAVLRAPFAGVITAKLANAGDTAMPGQPLLILEAPGALRLEARVPEAGSEGLQVGQTVPVRLEGLDHDVRGTVAELQPASDDATRTRLAKVDLSESSGLRAGRIGRLLLATGSSLAVSVPSGAVVRHGQLEGVFVVEAGTARLRLVRSGRMHEGRLDIASGLSGNERVVIDGAAELVDGERVQVRP